MEILKRKKRAVKIWKMQLNYAVKVAETKQTSSFIARSFHSKTISIFKFYYYQ